MKFLLYSFCWLCLPLGALTRTLYPLNLEPIDVVIPCCDKDLETLELCIQGIRQYGENIRRIIVVSKERYTGLAEWFDESLYPFSKELIALEIFKQNQAKAKEFLNHPKTRIGWIYQQFLKLYAPFVIPNISSNVLILDADIIFLNPVAFMNANGEPYFTISDEYHRPYLSHMARLLPSVTRAEKKYSGVAHHMLFQKPILEDLHEIIRGCHQVEVWKAFCRCISPKDLYFSPFSEYEVYFNFALLRTTQAHPRRILWGNTSSVEKSNLERYAALGYKYVASHSYAR